MPHFISLENDLNRVVNSAPLIIFQIDRNGIFTLSEGKALQKLGLRSGQVVGQSMYELYKPWPLIIHSFEEVLKTGKDIEFTVTITEDPEMIFETKMTAVKQGNEIVGVNGVALDVSERKILENELIESEERYRSFVQSAPFGILVTQDGKTKFVNDKFAKLFGYNNVSEFSSQPNLSFFPLNIREELLKKFNNREKGISEPNSFETFGLRKDGNEFPIQVTAQDINYFGKTAQMYFLQDITDKKRAEEQNQIMMKKLMNTQKLESLGILAGGIAHDFNNLLVGIMGFATLALSKIDSDSPIYDYLTYIEKSSKLASDLTRQMLNYSGKGQFTKETLLIKDLMDENKELFKTAVSKSHELIFEIDDNLPLIEVDETQIRQVILNLLVNASESIDHPNGKITFTISKMVIENDTILTHYPFNLDPGLYLELKVKDNGRGIPKDIQEKIFDPFFSTKMTGRGLGLAVVQGIVRGHKGAINVEGQDGVGTTFKIYLPVKEGLRLESTISKEIFKKETKSGTILICDDEEIVLDVTSKILTDIGYKVILARDGLEAINLFRNNQDKVNLVLLDLTMPKFNGEEVYYRIREVNPKMSFIISSGYSEKEVMVKFGGSDLCGFLQKPYSYEELVKMVGKFILQ